ncbi:hypothetical protein BE11_44115 [Sorangium cellulosum]|nr:hypothetical protein BE11_44115 [Sorangium cellulosum]
MHSSCQRGLRLLELTPLAEQIGIGYSLPHLSRAFGSLAPPARNGRSARPLTTSTFFSWAQADYRCLCPGRCILRSLPEQPPDGLVRNAHCLDIPCRRRSPQPLPELRDQRRPRRQGRGGRRPDPGTHITTTGRHLLRQPHQHVHPHGLPRRHRLQRRDGQLPRLASVSTPASGLPTFLPTLPLNPANSFSTPKLF